MAKLNVIQGGKGGGTEETQSKKLYAIVLSSDEATYKRAEDGTVYEIPLFTAPELNHPNYPILIYADSEDEAKAIYAQFVKEGFDVGGLDLSEIIVLGEVTSQQPSRGEDSLGGVNQLEITITGNIHVSPVQFLNDPITGERYGGAEQSLMFYL